MLNFALGAVAAAILYTFFPVLGEKPSEWLRKACNWLKFKA